MSAEDTSVAGSAVQGTAEPHEGCLCQECGNRYRVDFNVPDELWTRIWPFGPGGLLCGRCIAGRVEECGEFGAFELVPVFDKGTVERVARAMADTDGWGDKDQVPLSQVYDYTRLARAALQALRGDRDD